MARRKYRFLDEHIRGIYQRENTLPFPAAPITKQRASLSMPIPEAVFKIIGYAKSADRLKSMAEYIAERSEGLPEPVKLTDETGRKITADEFMEQAAEWDGGERKNGRVAVHFVVSFPKASGMRSEDLEAFATDYLRPFAEAGYSYAFAAHRHQPHRHVHVVLRLDNGLNRLEFNKREIEQMRLRQVEIAKEYGVRLQATRHQDRDFSLTQMVIPRRHKTIGQIRKLHEKRREHDELQQSKGRER